MSFGGGASRGRGHFPPTGGIPRARGRSPPVGCDPRVRGQESCPRRRRMPPPGVTRTLPRRMSPEGAGRHRLYGTVPDGAERPCGLCRRRSRTYFSVEDCVLLQKVTARAQSFGGEVRPGRRTQSSMGQDGRAAPSSRLVRVGRHNLVVVFTASTGARRPRWDRLPVPGCSGIGFAPWLQDDASTPTPALRPCASGPWSRARQTTNRPELGAEPAPTPPAPLTEPPDVG